MTTVPGEGWAAIDAALGRVYPGAHSQFFTFPRDPAGPNLLEGIRVHACDEGPPHWHYVSYGFSELHEKTWENRRKSGWGFEMSFRVARAAQEQRPQEWPLHALTQLARYVFETGTPFDVGHFIDMGGPLVRDKTLLDALVFALDAKLGKIDTPHGRVKFLTPIGIFQAEKTSIQQNQHYGFLRRYSRYSPLFVTDLARSTVLV